MELVCIVLCIIAVLSVPLIQYIEYRKDVKEVGKEMADKIADRFM